MNAWRIYQEPHGCLSVTYTNLDTGKGGCCGHMAEFNEASVQEALEFICSPENLRPGDLISLPSGELLQASLVRGQA